MYFYFSTWKENDRESRTEIAVARVSNQCFQDETVQAWTGVVRAFDLADLAQGRTTVRILAEDHKTVHNLADHAEDHKTVHILAEDHKTVGILADHKTVGTLADLADFAEDHKTVDTLAGLAEDHTAPRVEVQALARHHRVNYQWTLPESDGPASCVRHHQVAVSAWQPGVRRSLPPAFAVSLPPGVAARPRGTPEELGALQPALEPPFAHPPV